MKAINFFFILILGILISCSSDSDGSSSGNTTSFAISLNNGDYWIYDVQGQAGTSRDSLHVTNDTIINSKTYKKFKTKDVPTGFYSSSLNNNGVRKDNSKLLLSGSLDVGANQGLPSNITIELDDFIIFNSNASENSNLDSQSGSFQETVNGYPLTINYTLKSKAGANYDEYISNGVTYINVKSTIITLEMKVTTVVSGFTITVLNDQEVLNSEQYIAENIGVVNTFSTFSYSMDSTLASQIGIPASETQTQEEFLDTYLVN